MVVTNHEGVTIRSTFTEPDDTTQNYTNIITEIVERAKLALKDNDELTFLKIRTKKTEFIVVPGNYGNYAVFNLILHLLQTRTTYSSHF